jgi:hypothetical protein
MKLLPFVSRQIECGDCTKCCEGWNIFNIEGKSVKPGSPCKYVNPGVGCSLGDKRPGFPCKSYNCEWKNELKMPEEFKPSNCGFIINHYTYHDLSYYIMYPAPNDPSPEMIDMAKIYFKDKNFVHFDKDGVYPYGSVEFCNMIKSNELTFIEDPHFLKTLEIRKNL